MWLTFKGFKSTPSTEIPATPATPDRLHSGAAA